MDSLVSICLSSAFPVNQPFSSAHIPLELLKSLISRALVLPVESLPTYFYRPPRKSITTPISIKRRSLAVKSTPLSIVKKKFISPSPRLASSSKTNSTNAKDLENEIRSLRLLVTNKEQEKDAILIGLTVYIH
jgi:hypothetical protein